MNEIEKAIEAFKKRNRGLKNNPVCQDIQKRVDKQNYEIIRNELAIKALEKQTQQKPIHYERTENEFEHDKCPSCKKAFNIISIGAKIDGHIKHCNNCGQKLDWENAND